MRHLWIAALVVWIGIAAQAQDRATLVADSVTVQSDTTLAATGHVEVFFKGQRLTATAILYDRTADRLVITGPIRIEDGTGNLFLAEQAELSADLTEGLLTSARLVLNQHLQMAAAQIQRSDGGTITALRSVVASSCTICAGSTVPLWEIRAREVVHDATAHQIYFSDAQLRFYGVPVLYLPILRVPDPDLQRATGFLLPRLRSTTALGFGIQTPYFITLGQSRDLTLTPYLTALGGQTVALKYRQAFAAGTVEVDGSLSHDDLGDGGPRGYLSAKGDFDLGQDYKLSFYGISVSDDAYLSDYGISTADRLESQITLERVRRDLTFAVQLVGFQSVREGDNNSTLPSTLTDLSYEKRFLILGGSTGFTFDTRSEYRGSVSPFDANGDGVADGRDLGRISLGLDWNRAWVAPNGIVLAASGVTTYDRYSIAQDQDFAGRPQRLSGAAGVELRWPLIKAGPDGVAQVLQPVIQLVTATRPDPSVPNGDSTLVEFDEGNLFSLDRYPGSDAVEGGTWLNLGVSWLRTAPEGWTLGVTAGQVVRLVNEAQFSAASGLDGTRSDWLLAWSLDTGEGLSLTNRLILDPGLSLTKGELRFDYTKADLTLSGGYEYLLADPVENRIATTSEIRLAAQTPVTRNWSAVISGRYDIRAERVAETGLALDYRNECIDVTFSLSRSYSSSSILTPSTDLGLSVELLGFGGGSGAGPSRVCRR
ncbi:MAG: LPS-assembly protein LptD [Candidatus Saccharibacteria bacterium]|nr:LPS-assembly protein LptD [Pseudorhodobacter sp.]